MSLSTDVRDNEAKKFRDTVDGPAVAVTSEGDLSGLLSGVSYDDIQATFPTSTTELYTYLKASVTVAQIEITYSNSSKQTLLRARRL